MAQRDEGLDKLESFIAATAETRAVLEREANVLDELEDRLEDLGDDIDEQMKNLGQNARELDERHGAEYQLHYALFTAAPFMGLMGGAGYLPMFQIQYQAAGSQRVAMVAAADLLEQEYEAFPERREAAREALAEAARSAEQATEECAAAARAAQEAVEPVKDAVQGTVRALIQSAIEAFPKG